MGSIWATRTGPNPGAVSRIRAMRWRWDSRSMASSASPWSALSCSSSRPRSSTDSRVAGGRARARFAHSSGLYTAAPVHPVARCPSDDGKAAVGPELPLRAEAVGRHDDGQHLGHTHRAEPGRGLQDSGDAMAMGFSQHGELGLALERLELLELSSQKLYRLTGCRGKGTSRFAHSSGLYTAAPVHGRP